MSISRRRFLRYAACLPPAVLAVQAIEAGSSACAARAGRKYCLILNGSCALKESLEGYAMGLRAAKAPFEIASLRTAKPAPVIIAPAASLTDIHQICWLRTQIEAGALALVESGGAFLSSTAFRRQQSVIRSQLKLTMLQPVMLWGTQDSARGLPYVDFTWPVPARVRDFSKMIALNGEGAAAIARIEDKPVAFKLRLGAGNLVFLGSPLGPHILAGDREAQRWLEAFWGHA